MGVTCAMASTADRAATHEVVQCLFTGHLATAFDHTIQSLWCWLHAIECVVPLSPSNNSWLTSKEKLSTLILGRICIWVWGEEEEEAGGWRYKAFILFTWSQIYEESEVLCSRHSPPTYSHPPPCPIHCCTLWSPSTYVHTFPNRHMIVTYICEYKLKF